jgi:hypothetical protein
MKGDKLNSFISRNPSGQRGKPQRADSSGAPIIHLLKRPNYVPLQRPRHSVLEIHLYAYMLCFSALAPSFSSANFAEDGKQITPTVLILVVQNFPSVKC